MLHFPDNPELEKASKSARETFISNFDFVQGSFEVKIADMGLAKEIADGDDFLETTCGTPLYMAPQVLKGQKYSYKADIWSIGAIYFELLAGFPPFTGMNHKDLEKNLHNGTYKIPKEINISMGCLSFLNNCLQFDESRRFNEDNLVNHPYVRNDMESSSQLIRVTDDDMTQSYAKPNPFNHLMKKKNQEVREAYPHLNSDNAFILNVKDSHKFNKLQENTVK